MSTNTFIIGTALFATILWFGLSTLAMMGGLAA